MFIFVSKQVLDRYGALLKPQERFVDIYLEGHGVMNWKCGEDTLVAIPRESVLPAKFHMVMEREGAEKIVE